METSHRSPRKSMWQAGPDVGISKTAVLRILKRC
uniref:Protein tssc1 n=1 Tax=Triatoma infestans TaxID=30076 RepID=A0A161N0C5_TRIIF